jgi:hypothetical protein
MKYLENYKSFENVDSLKTKLTKDFIFNIEDIFLEFLEENDINVEKSYFNIESESWNKIQSLYDVPDDAFSISIYFSQYLRNDYTPIDSNILSQIIECIKRSVSYYNSLSINNLVGYNIQYRAIKRGYSPTTDTDIKIDNIDNLLKGDIYSIDITFFTI